MNQYANELWKEFRKKVIEIDEGKCIDCGRGIADGVVLQVHHKRYVKNRKPWEYSFDDCETLCRGCHAREHGEIRPNHGWNYNGEDDLGDLIGTCELCGTSIRYVHYVAHRHWEPMEVGTDCCDNLIGTEEASEARKKFSRLKRFLLPSRWVAEGRLVRTINKGFLIEVIRELSGDFSLKINGNEGSKRFSSIEQAKGHVFSAIDSGKLKNYFISKAMRSGAVRKRKS